MDDKTIKFIDSGYKELFQIPDGGSIRVTYPPEDGREPAVRACKYLDDYHFELKNGSGMPVTGISPMVMPTFSTMWNMSMKITPMHTSEP